MGDPLVIQRSLDHLHPVVRLAVKKVRDQLNKEGHSFEVFESFRTPQRQAFLYAQGRTRPGSKVTKAPPWSSYHQYGLAVDFVLKVNGNWSWETKGKFAKGWQRLHALGDKLGLEPLSWELPHLQYKGVTINQLRSGDFPDGGDGAWRDHLVAVTAAWNGPQAPPPLPPEFVGKAAIVDGDDPEAGEAPDESPGLQDNGDGADAGGAGTSPASSDPELARPATPGESGMSDAIGENNFGKVQPIVDKWEGGYVDHPADPGGATNMGITLATLSRWRGRVVSKAEVKALTRAEAWKIMKRYYYDVVRGDDLPLPVACAAHNAAVLSGPSRSAKFLQTALRSLGKGVSVDGAIGPQSLSAVSECDPFQLANAFFQVQENYLRSLKHFTVFGKGWLNRLASPMSEPMHQSSSTKLRHQRRANW